MFRVMKAYGLLLLFALSVVAETPNGTIEGSVTDSPGAAISKARIFVHWDQSGSEVGLKTNVGISHDIDVLTDKNGRFEIQVPVGFYDLFISAEAFSPYTQKVRVTTGSKVRVYPKLPPDPLVTKELGDAFFDK